MIGRITIKRLIKRLAGWTASSFAPFAGTRRCPPAACILVYHRISEIGFVDPHVDDWNVSPLTFEKQIAALAELAEFVPLLDLPARLGSRKATEKPLVALTFDDAFANCFTVALPILQRYRAHATVFAVTSTIGQQNPMPFDEWSQRHARQMPADSWRPMSWAELEACANSGLMTVGAHSHRHFNGLDCTTAELREEAEASFAILKSRLGGAFGRVYSYPYGSERLGQVSEEYIRAVRTAGFDLAVSTNLGLASSESNRFLLPRVEAHGLDTPSMIRAKAKGVLFPYVLTDRLRQAKRFANGSEKTCPSCPRLMESASSKRV